MGGGGGGGGGGSLVILAWLHDKKYLIKLGLFGNPDFI